MTELRALREWSLFIGRGGGGRGVSEDFGVSQLNSSDPSLRLFRILVTPPLFGSPFSMVSPSPHLYTLLAKTDPPFSLENHVFPKISPPSTPSGEKRWLVLTRIQRNNSKYIYRTIYML